MPIRLDRPSDHIARLTLSNPGKRNALTAAMWEAIPDALVGLEARVLVVEGEGGHFASGADISEFPTLYATPQASERISDSISRAFTAVAEFPAPTLAVVRGACVGGGAGLALACDLRIADSTARFAVTPAKLGLAYPFEDIRRLVAVVGEAHARDILFTARVVETEEAQAMGVWSRVVEPDALAEEATALAKRIAALSPGSLQTMKAMFERIAGGLVKDDADTRAMVLERFGSKAFRQGYAAFLEKRRAEF